LYHVRIQSKSTRVCLYFGISIYRFKKHDVFFYVDNNRNCCDTYISCVTEITSTPSGIYQLYSGKHLAYNFNTKWYISVI